MAKMTGLGKGLDALFATTVPKEEELREGELVRNRYCEAYRMFFKRNMPLILEMARHIRK